MALQSNLPTFRHDASLKLLFFFLYDKQAVGEKNEKKKKTKNRQHLSH